MTTPWGKKNPLLSLWLSGANRAAAAARPQALAEAGRQRSEAGRNAVRLWTDLWFPAAAPKRKTRPRR